MYKDFLQNSSIGYPNVLSPMSDSVTTMPPRPQQPDAPQPEPLLTLLTSHHPLLSTAINGSISAYASSKSYSPRFRSGAEFVERLGSPVVNTMGTAGRMTGVESGVRWMLRKRDSSEHNKSNKRRRTDRKGSFEADIESGLRDSSPQRHVRSQFSDMSIAEPLPPYDEQRSPEYEVKGSTPPTPQNQHWGTKLMMTTSALTAALNEESLRSLKYCLTWLLWANSHLGQTVITLKSVIEEWNRSNQVSSHSNSPMEGQDERLLANTEDKPAARDQATISRQIQSLKDDVLRTIKSVVNVVSTYAGGALPSNARELVRLHLKSLPRRFHLASAETSRSVGDGRGETEGPPPETVTSAQRVLSLATAGLDMTKQVSEILNSTIVSAEDWCDRFGKKRSDKEEKKHEGPIAWHTENIKQEGLNLCHVEHGYEEDRHVSDLLTKPRQKEFMRVEDIHMQDSETENEKQAALNLADVTRLIAQEKK